MSAASSSGKALLMGIQYGVRLEGSEEVDG
jgi:hypothetical protein